MGVCWKWRLGWMMWGLVNGMDDVGIIEWDG